MSLNVACVVVASKKRERLLDEKVIPSVLEIPFAEVVVVGDYHDGTGYRYLPVPPIAGTTVDALVKRDVGTLATQAPWVFYLCDDHAVRGYSTPPADPRTIGVPLRYSVDAEGVTHPCNMGLDPNDPNQPYCGGHAGLFSRALIQVHPWTSMSHDRLWDLVNSKFQMSVGAHLEPVPWRVEDLEPENFPWK